MLPLRLWHVQPNYFQIDVEAIEERIERFGKVRDTLRPS